ncbi:MAG: sulfotransferase family protein [Rhodanobacteraceae bacterium]
MVDGMRRVFVVGCPRSGTTLVQALIARHPDVFSLHETHFFEALLGDVGVRWGDLAAGSVRHWYHRAGLARSAGRRRLRELERRYPQARRLRPIPRRWRACARRYVAMLDAAARGRGRTHWVEKTPNHLLFLDEIAACAPGARFVHVLRNGLDVVASAIDADLRLDLGGFRGGVAHWTRRWNRAMALHQAHAGEPRHYLVCLEDLIADEAGEWRRLRAFLALDPDQPLMQRPGFALADVRDEPWKAAALPGVVGTVDGKAQGLFGPWSLAWLRSSLTDYRPIRAEVHRRHRVAEGSDAPPAVSDVQRSRREGDVSFAERHSVL